MGRVELTADSVPTVFPSSLFTPWALLYRLIIHLLIIYILFLLFYAACLDCGRGWTVHEVHDSAIIVSLGFALFTVVLHDI